MGLCFAVQASFDTNSSNNLSLPWIGLVWGGIDKYLTVILTIR